MNKEWRRFPKNNKQRRLLTCQDVDCHKVAPWHEYLSSHVMTGIGEGSFLGPLIFLMWGEDTKCIYYNKSTDRTWADLIKSSVAFLSIVLLLKSSIPINRKIAIPIQIKATTVGVPQTFIKFANPSLMIIYVIHRM